MLRHYDAQNAIVPDDTTDTFTFANFIVEAAKQVMEEENITGVTVTRTDVYKVLAHAADMYRFEIYDFLDDQPTFNSVPVKYLDYLLDESEITQAEYDDVLKVMDDEYWVCTADSLDTEVGISVLAVRDSSRAYWISKGVITPSGRLYDAGIVINDGLGALAGLAFGAAGSIVGGMANSLLFILGVELGEEFGSDYDPCASDPMCCGIYPCQL